MLRIDYARVGSAANSFAQSARLVEVLSLPLLSVLVSTSGCGPVGSGRTDGGCNSGISENIVASTFCDGDEGWRVLGGDFASATRPAWAPGVVSAEGFGEWNWVAPGKFLGDMSAAFDKRLSIDRASTTGCDRRCPFRGVVVLSGGGLSIGWGEGPADGEVPWTVYSVRLNETEEWRVFSTGARATDEQIIAVLSDLQQFEIFGQEGCCQGTTSLGGVRIE